MNSKYFVPSEFKCPCCGCLSILGIPQRLVDVLDCIREDIGKPLYVTSGFRCLSHNIAVGGAEFSQHLLGTAADVTCDDIDVNQIAFLAESYGADGIGLYPSQGFVHIDVRGSYARWSE